MKVLVLPGDGIGPEVTRAAVAVLRETSHEFHHQLSLYRKRLSHTAYGAGWILPAYSAVDHGRVYHVQWSFEHTEGSL